MYRWRMSSVCVFSESSSAGLLDRFESAAPNAMSFGGGGGAKSFPGLERIDAGPVGGPGCP